MFHSYFVKEDNPLTQPGPMLSLQIKVYYSVKIRSDGSLLTASRQFIQNTAVKLLGHVKLINKLQTEKAGKLAFFFYVLMDKNRFRTTSVSFTALKNMLTSSTMFCSPTVKTHIPGKICMY